jgi:hypothetical protein
MNFIRNHQPIEGIGNAMVNVCVTLNVQYQFKDFLKTQIQIKFCNFL